MHGSTLSPIDSPGHSGAARLKVQVPDAGDVGRLRRAFEDHHTSRLPELLSAELLHYLTARCEKGPWVPKEHGGIGKEVILDDAKTLMLLHFVLNESELLETVRTITGRADLRRFIGRMYRMIPNSDHYDSWHTDTNTPERAIGMSINLGPRPYVGGTFQLRKRGSKEILCELPNIVPGDAILFRIANDLEHRVAPVEGTEPKTAFAGWFLTGGADFLTAIRQLASPGAEAKPA